jgi:hypothetical protein
MGGEKRWQREEYVTSYGRELSPNFKEGMILCSSTDAELDTNQFVLDATCLLGRYKILLIFISINIISEKGTSDRGLTSTSRCEIQPVDIDQLRSFLGCHFQSLFHLHLRAIMWGSGNYLYSR